MNTLLVNQIECLINTFNRAYQIGDVVEVYQYKNHPDTFEATITHEATNISGQPMTWLDGKGSYDITHVKGLVKRPGECPECKSPYPHLYNQGGGHCEDCGHQWED